MSGRTARAQRRASASADPSADRPTGGAGAAPAGSFTVEQVDRLRRDGTGRLSVLLMVESGEALVDTVRVGVALDPLTGDRRDVVRVASLSYDEAAAQVTESEREALAHVWGLACPKGQCPGKVWALVQELRGQEMASAAGMVEAWSLAWTIDAMRLRDATESCGSTTMERVHVDKATGARTVGLHRFRCGSTRCAHCGVLEVGQRWRVRLQAQADADRAAGRPWAMLTLTLDPAAWCEAHGLPVHVTSAVQAQRWVGRAFRRFARAVRKRWPGTEMLRVIELHGSQWPHVHVLVRSSSERSQDARPSLLDAMTAEGTKWASWDEMADYAKNQRKRQREGALRVARCPTPATRREVSALALSHGFGLRLDLTPVASADMGLVADYAAKGPMGQGRAKRLADVLQPDDITREVTKGTQRVRHILARGVRCWAEAGDFLSAVEPEDRTPTGAEEVRILSVPLDVLVRELREAHQTVTGEMIMVDFSGEIPEPGQRRPRVVESVSVGVEVCRLLERYARELGSWGRRAREGPDGPAPPASV